MKLVIICQPENIIWFWFVIFQILKLLRIVTSSHFVSGWRCTQRRPRCRKLLRTSPEGHRSLAEVAAERIHCKQARCDRGSPSSQHRIPVWSPFNFFSGCTSSKQSPSKQNMNCLSTVNLLLYQTISPSISKQLEIHYKH